MSKTIEASSVQYSLRYALAHIHSAIPKEGRRRAGRAITIRTEAILAGHCPRHSRGTSHGRPRLRILFVAFLA